MALKGRQPGIGWTSWPTPLLKRHAAALDEARRELADAVDRQRFVQFLFEGQLQSLRAYAGGRNVRVIGDIPIYVSGESADVWASPHLFQLDARRRPRAVAGVPPDLFCATGQRWGNPLFDWRTMRREGYDWWVRRMRRCLSQCDLVRVDHFRGLAGYWHIPASEPTAERGRWVKGPGAELLEAVRGALGGLPVIAEDLGEITPDVIALRDQFNLPGMQVLQFAFGEDNSPMLPHNHLRKAVVYTGTHDNDTTIGWFRLLKAAEQRRVLRYAPEAAHDVSGAMLRLAWASVADLAIAPFQDVLELDTQARMNRPGIGTGNWGWRVRDEDVSKKVMGRLAELTEAYGRAM